MAITFAVWLSHDRGQRHLFELSTRESVTGLQPQAAVRYRGLAVGKVESIAFDDQTPGNVRVRLSVDEGTPLTGSTFATLGYQGVTGLAYVQLDDAGDSTEPLPPDDSAPPRIPLRPGLFSKLTDQGDQIRGAVEPGRAALQPDAEPGQPEGIRRRRAATGRRGARGRAVVGPAGGDHGRATRPRAGQHPATGAGNAHHAAGAPGHRRRGHPHGGRGRQNGGRIDAGRAPAQRKRRHARRAWARAPTRSLPAPRRSTPGPCHASTAPPTTPRAPRARPARPSARSTTTRSRCCGAMAWPAPAPVSPALPHRPPNP